MQTEPALPDSSAITATEKVEISIAANQVKAFSCNLKKKEGQTNSLPDRANVVL